ncbi:exopolysaccharide biosynthesis polyprenyl glycosylphosphotransferase [Streptomyces sp. NPDC047009]|uniref:exopolysaccharide biosynthesis polyprenyl glycosylphosphotransferase n=1 Tax=Streptomyces sp. NPDC047009 TaxID=3154496 RepID=UPI0033D2ECB4
MTTNHADASQTVDPVEQPTSQLPIAPPRSGAHDARRTRRRRRRPAPSLGRVAAPLMAVELAAVAVAVTVPVDLPAPVLVALVGGTVLLNARAGLYRPGLRPRALSELPTLLGRVALAWCAAAAVFAAVRPAHALGSTALLAAVACQAVLACAGRAAVHGARARAGTRRPQSTLVVGTGPLAERVAATLIARREYGMRPVGLVRGQRHDAPKECLLPVLETPQDIHRAVIQNTVRAVVFTEAPDPEQVWLFGAYGCAVWALDRHAGAGMEDHVWGHACRRILPAPRRSVSRAAKRGIDMLVSAVALLVLSPVLLLCAAAVRISDGPGVLFHQERVGRDGRPFTLLKFRSLRPSNAIESATRWSVAGDDLMSSVGRFLRRSSLDELPQLWNVLRGDMSLVGPRPERPYFVAQFSELHPGYAARHRMPVGITGFAQIHGLRGDTSIEDRARFDNHYIDTWSLWQDVCIMLRTASSLFRLGGS